MPSEASSYESTGASREKCRNKGGGGVSKQNKASTTANSKSSDNSQFPCPVCFKLFSSGQALGGHQNAHRYERKQYRAFFPATTTTNDAAAFIRSPAAALWNLQHLPIEMAAATPTRHPPMMPFTTPNHAFAAHHGSLGSGFEPIELGGGSGPLQFGLRPGNSDLGRHRYPYPCYYQPNWAGNAEMGPYYWGRSTTTGTDRRTERGGGGDDDHHQQQSIIDAYHHHHGVLDLELRLGTTSSGL